MRGSMGYAAPMRFSPKDLAVLEATPEVEIGTLAADCGVCGLGTPLCLGPA
jgi:rRNA maturation protein Nop10